MEHDLKEPLAATPPRFDPLPNDDGMTPAPKGTIWICGACGKRSRTRFGFDKEGRRASVSAGWDESCMLNAVLCHDDPVGEPRAVTREDMPSPSPTF